MKRVILFLVAVIILLPLAIVGCGSDGADVAKGPITVGSKLDLEGQLLGQMMLLILEDNGYEVKDETSFGATSVVRAALESDEIDMYPEYTGNGAFFFDEAGAEVWKDIETGWQRVKALDKEAFNIMWLRPAPVTNDWAIAIPRGFAEQEGLETLSDFAAYVNSGGFIKLIGSEEFVNSPAALPNFQNAYGFTLTEDQLLTVASGDTTQTEKAASEGTDDVNAAMAYSTDGGLSAFDLVVLADNLSVNPIYAPAPRVRGEIFQKFPEIADILNPVFESLSLETLQALNGKTAVEGQSPRDVAREYLEENNFL
jgi:osmoprotectant transport system substrate-binding protein